MLCKEYSIKYLEKNPDIWLASPKLDGHRQICIATADGNRFFSRRNSKVSGWKAENTDNLPHLSSCKGLPIGTILDGELLHPKGFSAVQSVVGSLPQKAIKYQEVTGYTEYHVFDILQIGDTNCEQQSLLERSASLQKLDIPFTLLPLYVDAPDTYDKLSKDNYLSTVLVPSFSQLLTDIWEDGGEGLVIKKGTSTYQQGKRSSSWLKLKEKRTFDVIIMGYKEPEYEYTGGHPEDWPYVEVHPNTYPLASELRTLVTKPHYMGWIGAITVGLLKDGVLTATADVKGITDEEQEYIKANRAELIGTVIEIKAQEIINPETLSLRHPRFNRFRPDKDPSECIWGL